MKICFVQRRFVFIGDFFILEIIFTFHDGWLFPPINILQTEGTCAQWMEAKICYSC